MLISGPEYGWVMRAILIDGRKTIQEAFQSLETSGAENGHNYQTTQSQCRTKSEIKTQKD